MSAAGTPGREAARELLHDTEVRRLDRAERRWLLEARDRLRTGRLRDVRAPHAETPAARPQGGAR